MYVEWFNNITNDAGVIHTFTPAVLFPLYTSFDFVIPAQRVFEWMQESKNILRLWDSGICSKTHKTGMTAFSGIAVDDFNSYLCKSIIKIAQINEQLLRMIENYLLIE